MPLSHGYFAVDHDVIGIVNDPVNYRIGNRAVVFGVRIDTVIPTFQMILRAEYYRTFDPCFNDLQQIITLGEREFAYKPIVQYQQINFLYALMTLPNSLFALAIVSSSRYVC